MVLLLALEPLLTCLISKEKIE
ncbi:hypothetical protein E2I00_018946 [Balaenoptera physalus]|uniref:Uncharacterized protein n=1 Tax=Balaenoptera physalus TaxID=9770 RepID=A0A6A1QNU1_BALPH|nr:hypothetical protein E2I00_018946 [Balaenoptera physalus]